MLVLYIECLLTDTGMTILEILDANMDKLLHLNQVTIATQIKDLLLQHLDITSVWTTNVNVNGIVSCILTYHDE